MKIASIKNPHTFWSITAHVSDCTPLDLILGTPFLEDMTLVMADRLGIKPVPGSNRTVKIPLSEKALAESFAVDGFEDIEMPKQSVINQFLDPSATNPMNVGSMKDIRFGPMGDVWIRRFKDTIAHFHVVFNKSSDDIGLFKNGNHIPLHLPLTSKIYTRPAKIPPIPERMLGFWADQMRIWKMNGVVVPQDKQLPFLNPILAVPKGPHDVRFVMDGSELNKIIQDETLQLDRPENIVQSLANHKWYAAMDISSFYLNFKVDEPSSDLLAFRDPLSNRIMKFTRSIFGIKGSGSFSCRLLAEELAKLGEFNKSIFSYADDLLLCSNELEHLHTIFVDLLKVMRD